VRRQDRMFSPTSGTVHSGRTTLTWSNRTSIGMRCDPWSLGASKASSKELNAPSAGARITSLLDSIIWTHIYAIVM
jgi:hypothetical protein